MGKNKKKQLKNIPATVTPGKKPALLFCYGTLNVHVIQEAIFGEALNGTPFVLNDYELKNWPNSAIFYITRKVGERVAGKLYQLTDEQIKSCDKYEGSSYVRTPMKQGDVELQTYVIAKVENGKETE